MVEFSPATREARVRFPASASFFFFSYLFSFVTSSHHRLSESPKFGFIRSASELVSVLNCVSKK